MASSWRNPRYPQVVAEIQNAGFEVYDFRHPPDINAGFNWHEIDPNWEKWSMKQFIKALNHPLPCRAFKSDTGGMAWANICVLVCPCGRSSHIEAGYMKGQGKPVIVLLDEERPELSYKLFDKICVTTSEVIEALNHLGV